MAAAVYGTGRKRKRNEDGGMTEEGSDPHKIPPSPVVDIRGLVDGVKGRDLTQQLQGIYGGNFGDIVNVLMLQHRALVEFTDTTVSSNLVTYAAKNQMYIFGQPVSINYSKDKQILNPPSRVVFIRLTPQQCDDITEADLVSAMQKFGTIKTVVKKYWAHVEYEDMVGSGNAVAYAAKNQVFISGHPVKINYANCQTVRPEDKTVPSPVVEIKDLVKSMTKSKLVEQLQGFGTITYVLMLGRRALVEYEDMTGSGNLVTYAAENPVYISGEPVSISYSTNERISVPPSRTVFIRFRSQQWLVDAITKTDLLEAMQVFGTISNVSMMPAARRALVEYEDMAGSGNAVAYAAENQVYVARLPVSIGYSKKENTATIAQTPPSPVVYIKFQGERQVDEADLVSAMQMFGAIGNVVMFEKSSALVEYEDMTGSGNAVAYAAKNQVYVSGQPVSINYGLNKRILRPSRAVYIRFSSEQRLVAASGITKRDLVEAMQMFGTISNVSMMLDQCWAVVEYEDMAGSGNAVTYAAENPVYISGFPVSINYSLRKNINVVQSPVVYVLFRGDRQVDDITEADLVAAMQEFGTIRHVLMMLEKRQAFVEYDDMTESANAVTYAAENQVYISGHLVFINYSLEGRRFENPMLPSPVVHVSFGGAKQPDDTMEVDLVAVMQKFGAIRHVFMMREQCQAFVEYEDTTGSERVVTYAAENPVYISGHPVFIDYSRQGRKFMSTNYDTLLSTVVYVKFGGKMQVDDTMEADLVAAMQEFGTIRHVYIAPEKRRAFVEYEDVAGSRKAVTYTDKNLMYISGHPVSIRYSKDGRRVFKTNVQPLPSPVVEIRGVVDGVSESKLVDALWGFGTIKHVLMIPEKRQAFVEYEDLSGSGNVVTNAAKNQVYVSGHPVSINYSKHKNLMPYNNVLMFTITNPVYPITTEVLWTVCKKCGPVQRIVISRTEQAVEAMVEFDNVLSAQRAVACLRESDNLQNYSGCSALIVMIVDANKPTRLNVPKNDQDTWDYTNPNRGGQVADVEGNRNNSPYPNANHNKRARQPTFLGERPPHYGGPQRGYHHNNNYESYGPPPHYEGRSMGPPMGVPPPHYEGRRMGPPMGVPPPEYGRHGDWRGRPWP